MRGVHLDSAQHVSLRRELLATAAGDPGGRADTRTVSVPFWSSWSVGLYVAGIDSVTAWGVRAQCGITGYFATYGDAHPAGRGISAQDVQARRA